MNEILTLKDRIVRLLSRWLVGSDAERETPAAELADQIIALVVAEAARPMPDAPPDDADDAIAEIEAAIDERWRDGPPGSIAVADPTRRFKKLRRRVARLEDRLTACEANGDRILDFVQDLAGRLRDHEERLNRLDSAADIPLDNGGCPQVILHDGGMP